MDDYEKKRQQHYEAVISLLSELKDEQSVPLLFKTARLFFSLNSLVSRDNPPVPKWQRQLDDLHSQLASSVIKFLQQFNQTREQFGNACLSLLYVGAEACERLEHERETLSNQLTQQRSKCAELSKNLEGQLKESSLKENMELRTRLLMQQQSLRQHEAERRELVHRLHHTLAEKNDLHMEKERLADECKRSLEILERQSAAISELMDESEDNAKQKHQALHSLRKMNEDNQILKLNLKRHSKVIENLINVNADMIEATNCYANMHDWNIGKENEDKLMDIADSNNYNGQIQLPKVEMIRGDDICIPSCFPNDRRFEPEVCEEKDFLPEKVS